MTTTVKDVMVKDVITIDGMAPVMDALQLMLDKGVKSVVILPRSESDAFGILTFSDIAETVIAKDEQLEMLNVFDLMTKPCYTVNSNLDIKYAARKMIKLKVARMPVTEGTQLLGLVGLSDMVRLLLKDRD